MSAAQAARAEAEVRGWAAMVRSRFASKSDAEAWVRMQLPKVEAIVELWASEQPSEPSSSRRRLKVQERLWAFLGQERRVAGDQRASHGESEYERRLRLERNDKLKEAERALATPEGQKIIKQSREQAKRLGLLRERPL